MDDSRSPRADLVEIFSSAIRAVDPFRLVEAWLHACGERVRVGRGEATIAGWNAPTIVVGAGKAAWAMARACESVLGPERIAGSVIVPHGNATPLHSIRVYPAAHPDPDEAGQRATTQMCRALEGHSGRAILVLLSGGASSLMVAPRPPLQVGDLVAVTRVLYAAGADITELNTVRKHLSLVKGGGLLRRCGGRPMCALILSDVVGDDPAVIGSGPTAADPTTYADALAVLERRGVGDEVPPAVRRVLEDGAAGRLPETVKLGDPETRRVENLVIGSNRGAVAAAADAAARLGYRTVVEDTPIIGDTRQAARAWAGSLTARAPGGGKPTCFIAGGETTVRVTGKGEGGRNQEFALAMVESLAGESIAALSAGSDGIDGPTDAAGAFVDGSTHGRAQSQGLDPGKYLADNDSHRFFGRLNDLFRPGPTGTNVMDIKIAIRT